MWLNTSKRIFNGNDFYVYEEMDSISSVSSLKLERHFGRKSGASLFCVLPEFMVHTHMYFISRFHATMI